MDLATLGDMTEVIRVLKAEGGWVVIGALWKEDDEEMVQSWSMHVCPSESLMISTVKKYAEAALESENGLLLD